MWKVKRFSPLETMLRNGKAILCPSFFVFLLFFFLIENISKKGPDLDR